ncbi:Proteasome subunit alpha type-2-A [Camellia lanceoleosa]|uniref:Proteasome subunit alpha type-2-A n=1 Tax=Camellia lanceoleosa TaxID=1840588 RepID=A0ACC0HGV6_9ERIC|nr:Proteasome subunit alpha type-2-A [Camellia lanceoleosa]
MGDCQYSFSLTTFSPSGKLVQIEHALIVVGSGQTSLGIKATNGAVIATEKKRPSILVDEASVNPVGVSRHRAFTACLPRRTVNLVCKVPRDVKKSCDAARFLIEKAFTGCLSRRMVNLVRKVPHDVKKSCDAARFLTEKANPVGVSCHREFIGCLPRRTVNLVRKVPHDVKKSYNATRFLTEKVNPVGVSRHRAFTGCLPRRMVNLVRKVPHDVKKSCDAARFLIEKVCSFILI